MIVRFHRKRLEASLIQMPLTDLVLRALSAFPPGVTRFVRGTPPVAFLRTSSIVSAPPAELLSCCVDCPIYATWLRCATHFAAA